MRKSEANLIAELQAEFGALLGTLLGSPPPARAKSFSAMDRWNACWTELRDEHPELFHRDFRL